ncbi:MAG: inosamine-phosphate amidinotransferase 1, partial [bacterium]|nr:inosamine-phosphate amidinotransferase 1 [bacterium]
MSLVNIHNEWDPLEEIIVGVPDNARVPIGEKGLFAIEYNEHHKKIEEIPSGPYEPKIIEETREDIAELVEVLENQGVIVRRPHIMDHSKMFSSPHWESDGEYNYCPRDIILTIGQTIIETPMPLRSRFFETLGYKDILIEYFKSGAKWLSAPKPRLLDDTYNDDPKADVKINNYEPLFDAANVLRAGRDILYLVSCSGNMMGYEWLQRTLGDEYRVHPLVGIYEGTHIDTTITLLGPGRVLLNPGRINKDNMPDVFKKWDIIWCPEMIDTGYSWDYPRASVWSGMNFFMIKPDLAIVNESQKPLMKLLEKHGIDVIPLKLRNCRTLSG